jgi:hypothetical protein
MLTTIPVTVVPPDALLAALLNLACHDSKVRKKARYKKGCTGAVRVSG